jgi:hypothetical protein
LRTKKAPQGIAEHRPDIVTRQLGRGHGKN